MFLLQRPSRQSIDRFLEASRDASLSYGPQGLTRLATVPHRWDLDETVVITGRGPAVFERAKNALQHWQHFAFDWVELHASNASVEAGTNVAIVLRHLGFWSMNGGRIVYRLEEPNRFGFAYGTLTTHAEAGEELFEVFLDEASGDVKYRIRAVSRPRAALARLGYPIVRRLQNRFRADSAAALRRAVSSTP